MAQYFTGRRQVGHQIELTLESGKAKLFCSIFEYWLDNVPGCTLHCGAEANAEITRTVGITTKSSETLESTIESSIGINGVAQLKSSLKRIMGHEVTWARSVSTKMTFPCKAPKCGTYELSIYQLIREYELSYYRRGWLFRSDIWDQKWAKILVEETEKYDAIPDKTEYDEQCLCEEKISPAYDGRLYFDFGNLSLRAPYKLTSTGFDLRIAEHIISFTFSDYAAGVRGLEQQLSIVFGTEVIPDPLKFLGNIKGSEAEGRTYKYVDAAAPPTARTSNALISLVSSRDIHKLLAP